MRTPLLLLLPCAVFFIMNLAPLTQASDMNLLMVGNSFSEVHNMEEMIQTMLEERSMMLKADTIFAARFEVGGANLTHYASESDLTTMIKERPWTWVILQEQSQIPGFCDPEVLWSFNDSLKSIMSLDDQIEQNGATTILFETWGYFDVDPYNPGWFPNYTIMQEKLTKGYGIYRDNILEKNPSSNVKIAPAGLAFDRIYKTLDRKGENPLQEGSLFEQLFMRVEDHPTPDHNRARKYPTIMGAYLCGCVLFQTLTNLDVRKSTFTPEGMTPQQRIMMQKVAYDTVVEFNGGKLPLESSHQDNNKKPYKPEYKSSSSERMGETRTNSIGNWVLATVLMGAGLASYWIAAKKRAAASVLPSRDYGWDAVASEELSPSMELSDVTPSRGPLQ